MNPDTWTLDEPLYSSLVALTDLILKGILILLGARIITALMSKTAAAARHLVWTVALVMIFMLPALSFIMPQVQLALFEHPLHSQIAVPEQPVEVAEPVLAGTSGELAQDSRTTRTTTSSRFPERTQDIASSPRTPTVTPDVPEAPALVEAGNIDKNISFLASSIVLISSAHWTSLVMIVWGLGAALTMGWILIGLTGAWWITQHAYQVEGEAWDDLNEELSDRLMVYRPVRLMMSASIASPMTWGIWRPVILLPVDADDWSEERRRYVLLHELAHVKRWDTVTQLAAQLGCAIHWFNPLAWRSLYRMRMEQEKACDDLVLSHGMKASDYASHLLDIARSLKMPWTSPLNTISMAKPSQLEGRVVDILDPDKKQRTINKYSAAFTCVVAMVIMLPIAAMSPWRVSEPATDYALVDDNAFSDDDTLARYPDRAASAARAEQARQNLAGVVRERFPAEARSTRSWTAEFERVKEAAKADARASANPEAIAEAIESLRAAEGSFSINFPETHKPAASDDVHFLAPGIYPARVDTSEKQREARKKAIATLKRALDDSNAEVRRFAIITLGEMGDRSSVDVLVNLVENDSDRDVRRSAIMALSEINSPAALDGYLIALNDRDAEVRRFAVFALAERDEDEALEALLYVLDDRDPEVRQAALMALGDRRVEEALPMIKKALRDGDSEIRRTAVMALAEYKDDEVLPLLRIAVEDRDKEVRRNALIALADCEDEESMELFVDILLSDSDAEVRKFAAVALGEIGNVEAIDALTKAMEDSDPDVRRQATIALSQLDYGERGNTWHSDDDWGNAGVANPEYFEEFGASMARLGAAAGRLGVEASTLSLGLTADILGSLAENGFDESRMEYELEAAAELYEAEMELAALKLETELELAELEREVEMELAEMRHELDLARHDLEQEGLSKSRVQKLMKEAELELAAEEAEAELELAAMKKETEVELAAMEAELALKRRHIASEKGEVQNLLNNLGFINGEWSFENNGEFRELMDSLHELEGQYDEPDFCETLTKHLKEKNSKDARSLLRNMDCRE